MRMPREDRSHHDPFGGPRRPVWTMRRDVRQAVDLAAACSAERVVELPPDRLGLPVQRVASDQAGRSPRFGPARRQQSLQPGRVLDDQAGADAVLRPATDTAGMEDRLGVLEAGRDGRTAAPRRPDDEAAERPVVADQAVRRLGRCEGFQQVRPVLAGRERSRARPSPGRSAASKRPDPRVDRLVTQPGRLQDAIPVWTSNPIFS